VHAIDAVRCNGEVAVSRGEARLASRREQGLAHTAMYLRVASVTFACACLSVAGANDASSDAPPDLPSSLSCIGSVTWPTPATPSANLGAQFVDFTPSGPGTTPQANLAVKACARDDATCATVIASGSTASDGTISLAVPTGTSGFDGYFDVAGADRFPELAFFLPPIVTDTTPTADGRGIPSIATMSAIATAAGTSIDPARAHLIVRVRDCTRLLTVSGASIVVDLADASSVAIAMSGGGFVKGTLTDSTGLVGMLDVPPGAATITVTLPQYARTLGTTKLILRAGVVTTTSMSPTS
jgi:hypothetical protein